METGFHLSFPIFIKWNITGRCNLRCRHCFLSNYASEPPLGTVRSFAEVFKREGVASVILTGGEPLLRPDLPEIVGLFSGSSIRVGLATNGTLMTEALAKELAGRGLRQCQVSLDGHDKNSHEGIRGEGTFQKALAAVAALRKAGVFSVIGHTLNLDNAGSAGRMLELAEAAGANDLRYELYLPVRAEGDAGLRFDLAAARRLREIIRGLPRKKGALSVVLPCFLNSAPGADSSVGCGAGTTTCVLNSDLSLAPCDLLSEKERTAPLAAPSDFGRAWREDEVFRKWRNVSVADAGCAACPERRRCGYGCRASALAYSGDFSARDPLCILAGDGPAEGAGHD